MKTALIFYSKHGTTERVAHLIGKQLDDEVAYISLAKQPNPDLQSYDRIIIGTSIYVGKPPKKARIFCEKNQTILAQKVCGVYICCMNTNDEQEELSNAFPDYLQRLPIPKAILGGEFNFESMNFIERFITRKVTNINATVSRLRHEAIQKFAQSLIR